LGSRKWVSLSNGEKISQTSLMGHYTDDTPGGCPGRAWLSREEFDAWAAATNAWSDFLDSIRHRYRHHPSVTAADIAEARRLLRLDEPLPDLDEDDQ